MQSLYLLIPLSIVLVAVAIWAFFWAVNRGQFDDMEEQARLALEEDPPLSDNTPNETTANADANSPRE
ncbi:MAG: cbb3-type cytochrome oxidase assembly protein CcoS [Steroidobacteraceae bacterium]